MHRIGIISDTHGLLRPEVTEVLQGCEAILHGGDINNPGILDKLNQIAPTYAVRGNNDREWAKDLPETLLLKLYGISFFKMAGLLISPPCRIASQPCSALATSGRSSPCVSEIIPILCI